MAKAKPTEPNTKPNALSGMSGAIRNFREQPPPVKIPKTRGRPRKRVETDPVHDPTTADEEPSPREKEWQTEVNYNIKN
jgi:hypothetical protein